MADKTNNKNFKKSFNRWFWEYSLPAYCPSPVFSFYQHWLAGLFAGYRPITESY